MQQVDNKNYKNIVIGGAFSMLLFMGCATQNKYMSNVQYYDQNITKDQLLHAAKRVFNLSDKNKYVVDSYRDELNVTKSKAFYKMYTMQIRNDYFNLKVDENNTEGKLKVTLSLSRTYGIEEEEREYLGKNNSMYGLFWDRVDYLLGRKDEWTSCAKFRIDEKTSSPYESFLYDSFFCDFGEIEDNKANKSDIINLDINVDDSNESKKSILFPSSTQFINEKPKPVKPFPLFGQKKSIKKDKREKDKKEKDKRENFDTIEFLKMLEYTNEDLNLTEPFNNEEDTMIDLNVRDLMQDQSMSVDLNNSNE